MKISMRLKPRVRKDERFASEKTKSSIVNEARQWRLDQTWQTHLQPQEVNLNYYKQQGSRTTLPKRWDTKTLYKEG